MLKVKNSLDMWSAFLTRNDLLKADNLPEGLNNASLKKAITVLGVMNFSPEEREAYEDHLKWLRVETNTLKKMRAEGKAEGKVERNMEIAKNLLSQNIDINTISIATGLSIEEIKKLKS